MKKMLLILVTIFIGGCDGKHLERTPNPDFKEMLINEITRKVALQLKKEKDLHSCGFGGKVVPHITMLALSFNYYKEVDVEKARDLLVTAGSLFLKSLNENEKIRPYLKNYPFESKDIEICIFLRPKEILPDALTVISMINDRLDYEIKHPKTGCDFKMVHAETYEEALAEHNKRLSKNFKGGQDDDM